MAKRIVTAFMLFSAFFIYSQNNITSTGGNATGSSGMSSYTIGEVAYDNATNNKVSSAEGVQQAYKIVEVVAKKEMIKSDLVFTIYPNPTKDLVNIKVENYEEGFLSYQLFSTTGQLISTDKVNVDLVTISMKKLTQGTYFIKVAWNDKNLKTYKIIKN